MTPLEQEFHNEMVNIYEQTTRYNYRPTRFLQIVQERGGVNAAKYLLAAPGTQEGLFKLYELKRLDLSMEALVIQDRYASLFEPAEIEIARKRLQELGYNDAPIARVTSKPKSRPSMTPAMTQRAQVPHTEESDLRAWIQRGEDRTTEFKIAACWNARTGKKDESMKDNVLQGIAAFLNGYDAGDIIIGVEDKTNTIVGLEPDYIAADPSKKNRDGYERWLRNSIANTLGADVTAYYALSFYKLDGQDVLRIHLIPSPKPIYFDGELYIRDGNGKRKLKAAEVTPYIKHRWPA